MEVDDLLQNVKHPVDFLIVTALMKERDAILAHFENIRKVQLEGSPTYHISTLPVIEQDREYEVAVTMFNQMGNVEAAQHTTQAIKDLNPNAVLMVGIAGGVKGKVKLGDVVVANQVLYYEQAKQCSDGIYRRPQIYPVDQTLLDRAQNYNHIGWRNLILAENPQTGEATSPKVIFGPIAVGEKVIADPAFVAQLKNVHSNLVGVEMESFGVAVAAANAFDRPRFLTIRGICDYADVEKDDLWHEYAAATAAAFTIGFLRSGPVLPRSLRVPEPTKPVDKANTLIVIRHQSMEFFPVKAIQQSLPPELESLHIKELRIDQSDLPSVLI